MYTLITDAQAENQRLDQWLAHVLRASLSRARIQSLIKAGHVCVAGKIVSQSKYKLQPGLVVQVALPPLEEADPVPQDMPLEILYEDSALLVVNKPAGLVVHPGNGHQQGTLVNALLFHCRGQLSGIGGVRRPGIVHRLDKDTSGVMVVAKNDKAHKHLSAQFADHGRQGALRRLYRAFVWGVPEQREGRIEAALARAQTDRTKRAVVPLSRKDAKAAVTHFTCVERFFHKGEKIASVLSCHLETGRTHQIRVHMAHAGFPLIGDPVYGSGFKTKAQKLPCSLRPVAQTFARQALHAEFLQFSHPDTEEIVSFSVPLPEDMENLLANLRCLTTI